MATRTKGKSVVSGRPGIIDHQNNPTNTRLGGRSTREEFNPKEFSSPTEHDRTTPAAAIEDFQQICAASFLNFVF